MAEKKQPAPVTVTVAAGNTVVGGNGDKYGPGKTLLMDSDEAAVLKKRGVLVDPAAAAVETVPVKGPVISREEGPRLTRIA